MVDVTTAQWDCLDATGYVTMNTPAMDQSANLQSAINAAVAQSKTLLIPAGKLYLRDPVIIPHLLRLRGMDWRSTELVHMMPNSGQPVTPMFTLAPDVVQGVNIGILTITGNGMPGENCFELRSSFSADNQAGLWYSQFYELFIHNFGGKSIWLSGEHPDAPMQFVSFRDIVARRNSAVQATSRSLSLTGKVGQIYFEGANEFDGLGATHGGVNVCLSALFKNGQLFGDAGDATDSHGNLLAGWNKIDGFDVAPYAIDLKATMQNSNRALLIDGAWGVTVADGWLENVPQPITVQNRAQAIRIERNAFANCGYDGTLDGYIVKNRNSWVSYGNNWIYGQPLPEALYVVDSDNEPSEGWGYSRSAFDTLPSNSEAISASTTAQVSPNSGLLDASGNETFIINSETPYRAVCKITSRHNPGSTISLTAWDGPVKILASIGNTAGNIVDRSVQFGGGLLLRQFDSVTLRRFDSGSNWHIVGRSIADLAASAMPASGYFEAGEFVRNTSASSFTPTSGKLLRGWSRATTGTSHTSSDWTPVYGTDS